MHTTHLLHTPHPHTSHPHTSHPHTYTQFAYTAGAYAVAKRVAAVLWRECVESDSGGDGEWEEEEQLYK